MKSIDPRSNELIHQWPEHDAQEVERRLTLASRAFADWKGWNFDERALVWRRVGDLIEERADDLARTMVLEMGKVWAEAAAEVRKCAWVCRYFADNAEGFLEPEPVHTEALKSMVRFDPLGLILGIMPWNFPYWQVFRFAAPALMAGNGMLLKHAPNVQGCAQAIEQLCLDAGMPEGLLINLRVSVDLVPGLIADERVAGVTLTGSERAGRAVAAQAGAALKKTVMELGGSDPCIVLDDADLDLAIDKIVTARILTSGQTCCAAKRIIVTKGIAPEFTKRFVAAMEALKVGDPMVEGVRIGPLARPDLMDNLERQVQQSVVAGAKVLCGGERVGELGNYYRPTVVTQVERGMPAWDEEVFGPVAALFVVEDVDEAVRLANDNPYGLTAGLWTEDRALAEQLAERLEVGGVFVNRVPGSDPRLPFGGVKRSGYGRELGKAGIREFVNVKSVWIA